MKNNKNQLKKLCDALKVSLEETVPEGWYTMKQIAQADNLSVEQTTKKVRTMIDQGVLVSCKFKIRSGNVVRPILHYSLSGQ
jgi:hypothetical protein